MEIAHPPHAVWAALTIAEGLDTWVRQREDDPGPDELVGCRVRLVAGEHRVDGRTCRAEIGDQAFTALTLSSP